eukprot:TRINITY_DN201_c0_g1_i2.p2 TRINITY_DN201_c0_g1~~TRINITY_DN201_c0_g1_i2.p2  ORF type:complete len:253 (+),score=128.13 TRINITY_DN201_c0_g1_i2:58-816(+)
MSITSNPNSTVLKATENDVQKMLACKVHMGTKNLTSHMERYTTARRKDGIHILNLHMTWEKLMMAARAIVAIENPADVAVVCARPFGQRAVLKFAQNCGVTAMAGRFCPGSLTNQKQEKFAQPRLIIVTDPRTDHQAITESAYVNIPVIAFCDTDSPLTHVDMAIPCNNRGKLAIGMMYWLLSREVLRMRNSIPRALPWEVAVDLFFYRDPEEVMKKEEEEKQAIAAPVVASTAAPAAGGDDWADAGADGEW